MADYFSVARDEDLLGAGNGGGGVGGRGGVGRHDLYAGVVFPEPEAGEAGLRVGKVRGRGTGCLQRIQSV